MLPMIITAKKYTSAPHPTERTPSYITKFQLSSVRHWKTVVKAESVSSKFERLIVYGLSRVHGA